MENEQMKSDSLWWYSHTSPEISKLVAEDVKEVDQSVKEMLQLIEHNGDFSVELAAHIKEFSRRYHLLAERYSGLTGELHKYVESGTKIQNNEAKVFDSQQSPSTLTPDKKLGTREFEGGDFTFNLSVSSGRATSDISLDESSRFILLSSDSDSESYNSSPSDHVSSIPTRKMPKHANLNIETELSRTDGVVDLTKHDHPNEPQKVVDGERYEEILKRISTYEEQLRISNQKLGFQEEEIARMKSVQRDNASVRRDNASLLEKLNSMKFMFDSAKDEIRMHEVCAETEKRKVSQLKVQIAALEAQLESEKNQVVYLQESITKYNADVAERDYEIKKLTASLHDTSENFASEKVQLESRISNLSKRLTTQESRTEEWELQCESLVKEIKQCEANKNALKQMQEAQISWQDEIESMTLDLYEKNECVKMMNKDLDRLKLENDTLRAEKDELTAKLQTLVIELCSREKQVLETEYRLHQLSEGSENANKEIVELTSWVVELEKEVELQRVLISDRAEEKREAIRQLCLAIEHYRNMNEELRSAFKRPAVMVS